MPHIRLSPLTITCVLLILSVQMIICDTILERGSFFFLSCILFFATKPQKWLIASTMLVPLIQIVFSHFLIEPIFSYKSIDYAAAFKAYTLVVGLIYYSVAWIRCMDLRNISMLSQYLGRKQLLICLFCILRSLFDISCLRWKVLSELNGFWRAGNMREKRKIVFREIPEIGGHLTFSSLSAIDELTLSAVGRNIDISRNIPNFHIHLSVFDKIILVVSLILFTLSILYRIEIQ